MFGAVAATAGAIVAGDDRGIVWILDWPPFASSPSTAAMVRLSRARVVSQ
jgi:hypothetical protein